MQWVKLLHIGCVLASFSGFLLRGFWMMTGSSLLHKKYVKIIPHIVDSILLISALFLVYLSSFSILENNWLVIKIVALVIYILLGAVALKYGKNKSVRILAFVMAGLVYLYIVSVALTKSASGFFAFFGAFSS